MENFGTRLKQTMEEANITASELSRMSGVGKNLISYYIHGRCLAKQDKVYMLAKALHVDPAWLMTGVEQRSESFRVPIVVPNNEQFVKLAQAMSPQDYETVMRIFEKAHQKLRDEGVL